MKTSNTDVVILGGGAAGLMCALEAGSRGRSVIVLEHNKTVGEKIRISGGGRCNFTNLRVEPRSFLSNNRHFCTSALSRYTNSDFISLVEKHGIRYHEKTLGQLFCDGSSRHIIDMLLDECRQGGVQIRTGAHISGIAKDENFTITTSDGSLKAESVVVATGGLSVPKLGASDLGYRIAKQFGLAIVEPRPGLVPLRLEPLEAEFCAALSGVSADAIVRLAGTTFREHILFTHKGLSGPSILQISSYWNSGDEIHLNLLPDVDVGAFLDSHRHSEMHLSTALEDRLPRRFIQLWFERKGGVRQLRHYSLKDLRRTIEELMDWRITPQTTDGFGNAEVTVGGVDTATLSSKTMESKSVRGLYFVGEVVDVTGWLGGYNFQWAWSSGWAAGQSV